MEHIWNNINKTLNVPQTVIDKWWDIITDKYSEPNRVYHNMDNLLQDKFNMFKMIENVFEDPDPVKFAIFFQNLEFDPTTNADFSEQNVEYFQEFYKDTNLNNEYFRNRVISYLRGNGHSNNAGGDLSEPDQDYMDKRYFRDFELAILGTKPVDYMRYIRLMDKEYIHLETYKRQRMKVLQTFKFIPFIYETTPFQEKFESQARDNIKEELEILKGQI